MNRSKPVNRKKEKEKLMVYMADDEEPECNRCYHVDGDEAFCTESCGPEHAWFGYRREVVIKWEDRRKEE